MGTEKVCKNCGKKFYAEDSRKKIFCCYKCRHSYELMMKRLNQSEEEQSPVTSQGKPPTRKLVSIADAASYLGVSKRTISNYISNGEIQVITIGGRSCRW